MTDVAAPPPPTAEPVVVRRGRPWGPARVIDLIVTILLLLANPVAIVIIGLGAALLLFGGADSQNDTHPGEYLTQYVFIGCIVVAIAGTVVSIVLLVRRHLAWWVALLTLVLVAGGGYAALLYWDSLIG